MRRVKAWLALTPEGRALAWRCLRLLPIASASLRLRGLAATAACVARLGRDANEDDEGLAPSEIVRIVHAVAAFLRTGCLARAVVLSHAMRSRGHAAAIRLGVRAPDGGGFAAHAWVELDGRPLNERAGQIERYTSLPALGERLLLARAREC